MNKFLLLITAVIVFSGGLKAQGMNALENVVPPCQSGLLLKIDYRGFGMISTPEGKRVYLQVCQDGTLAYQGARGRLHKETLESAKMSRLKAELRSPELEKLDAHYTAPMAIDSSISLYFVIQREGRTQYVKVDNIVTAWPPPPLDRLLTLADTFRSEAEFAVVAFRP